MEVIIDKDAKTSSLRAARLVCRFLRSKPNAVLGLATGGTPLMLYSALAEFYRKGEVGFSQVTTFNLDEYVGLRSGDANSYRSFMDGNFFDKIDIDKSRTHVPDGNTEDIATECANYERAIRAAGGIDLQILGIGKDGHIGFNEPSSSFTSRTRLKILAPETLADNARFFGGDKSAVPHRAITMGIGTIMEARSIFLLAYGEGKAAAVAGMVEGALTAKLPASILQMHPQAKIFLDEAAASRLELADYYKKISADLIAEGKI